MNGAKLRERLSRRRSDHHVQSAPCLARPLGAAGGARRRLDLRRLRARHWGFEDVRNAAQVIRGAGGAAIVRPDSHQRPLLIRYLNAGADGLMVPMVDTAAQARAIVDAVRYACPADHEKRLVVFDGRDAGGDRQYRRDPRGRRHRRVLHRTRRPVAEHGIPAGAARSASPGRRPSSTRSVSPSTRSAPPARSPARW